MCVTRTLIHGDKKAGFTVFWADDGLDTGPVLLQRECAVEPNDTVDTLYNRFLFPEGIKAMVATWTLTTLDYMRSVIHHVLSRHIFIPFPIMPSFHSALYLLKLSTTYLHRLDRPTHHRLRCHTHTISWCRWSRCSSSLIERPLEFPRQRKVRAMKAFRRNPTPR